MRPMTWLPVRLLACTLGLGATAVLAAAPFTADDLVRLKRISDPQVSPDGSVLAFVQRETDMEANKGRTSLWLLDLLDPAGEPQRRRGGAQRLQSRAGRPTATRSTSCPARSGTSQVWRLDLPALAAQQVTDYPLDVGSLQGLPARRSAGRVDGGVPGLRHLAVHARASRTARARTRPPGALYERLFVRHWDTLERRHALAPVHRAAERGRHGRRAGGCLAGLRCRHSRQALRR